MSSANGFLGGVSSGPPGGNDPPGGNGSPGGNGPPGPPGGGSIYLGS